MAKTVVLKKAVRPAGHIAPLPAKKKTTDPTVMTWRALVPLRVGDAEGTTHIRQFGDFVPEAATWKNLNIYLKTQQLEIAYVNQSELDAWREAYEERIAEEDAVQQEAEEREAKRIELLKQLRELEKQDAKSNSPETPANSHQKFEPEKTQQEKIDFGGVKMKDGGMARPVSLPTVTRDVPQQKNVAENRTLPSKTGRTLRKKV